MTGPSSPGSASGGCDEHALRAFEVHALDYLLKRSEQERFHASVDQAVRLLPSNDSLKRRLADLMADVRTTYLERVVIKTRTRVYFVCLDEVDWIEAAKNYVPLHAAGK